MNETLSQTEAMDFLKIKSRVTLLKIIKSGKIESIWAAWQWSNQMIIK